MGKEMTGWSAASYKTVIVLLVAILTVMTAVLVVLVMQQADDSKPVSDADAPRAPTSTSATAGAGPLVVPAGSQVLIVGDSYAQGTGASSEATRWTSLLAADRRWSTVVDGIGGTGFTAGGGTDGKGSAKFSTRIAAHAEDDKLTPSLVILEGGQNDYAAAAADLTKAVADDVAAVRSAWPQAKVLVIGPAAPEPLATDIQRMDTSVQAGARAAGAWSINPRATKWFTAQNSPSLNFDGAHVNDAGHRLIAQKIGEALDQFENGTDPTF